MTKSLLPLPLMPAFQNYLWGGTRLRDLYHKSAPKDWDHIAESWELSTHPHGLSKISGDPHDGLTFLSYLQQAGPSILGAKFTQPVLPVMIKLIDAKDNLSIQVHPDDNYARQYENSSGKTEMWYVIDAEADAFIYYGFKKQISPQEFKHRIEKQTLLEVVRRIPAQKGDVFFIPAGTLHAIGKGLLIAEVQQCCDITYRIYDYGRLQNGKPRELHLESALKVTNLDYSEPTPAISTVKLKPNCQLDTLVTDKNFTVKKITMQGQVQLLSTPETYQVLLTVSGDFNLIYQNINYPLPLASTIFLPANLGAYDLQGEGEILLITDH